MALKTETAFLENTKAKGFNEDALINDKEKITTIYNGTNPKIKPAIETEGNKTTKLELKIRQKTSSANQALKKFNRTLNMHPIYLLMKKIIGPALVYGSFGLLVAGILTLAYPPAAAAVGGLVILYLICFGGGAIVFPILQNLFTKAFWAIYSSMKGRSAKKIIKNNLIE